MSVIQKIRSKGGLAAGVIAVSLVLFVIGSNGPDIVNWFRNMGRDFVVKVNGEKVDGKEYLTRQSIYESVFNLNPQRPLDDQGRAQMRAEVVRDLIGEEVVKADMAKLGLIVSKEELDDMCRSVLPQIPFFKGEDGQIDQAKYMRFEKNKPQSAEEAKQLETWINIKKFLEIRTRQNKLPALAVAGVYAPSYLAKREMQDMNTMAGISYVKVPFTAVDDNDPQVKVSDDDIKKYIEAHPAKYSIYEPTRSIEYISFDLMPSKDDSEKVMSAINNLKADFASSTNLEAFVGRNSDEPYSDAFVTKKTFQSMYADTILNQPIGTVFGPYFENGGYRLTKIVAKSTIPDSVKAQHILIALQTHDDSAAHKTADSLLVAVKGGISFDSLATKFSEDPGSKDKGGDLGYFPYGAMVPEFNSFCFEGKAGEMKVVKTQFGYHVIRINDQKNFQPSTKIATVAKALMISNQTTDNTYANATQFAGKNTNAKAFDEAAKKENLTKRSAANVKVSDFTINGLGSSMRVIQWMYNAKAGDVSPVLEADGRYIVAKLTDAQEKGLMKPDANNRTEIESNVRAEKKAKFLKAKYKGVTSLEAVAQASGQQVMRADTFNAASPNIPNIGYAPKVAGYSFYKGFNPNTVSPGLDAGDGLYFIVVNNRWTNNTPVDAAMLEQQAKQSEGRIKGGVSNGLMEYMKRSSDVEYNVEQL